MTHLGSATPCHLQSTDVYHIGPGDATLLNASMSTVCHTMKDHVDPQTRERD